MYFNGTDLNNFVKVASTYIGDEAYMVPTKLAHDAMNLYNEWQDKPEYILDLANNLHAIDPGMDKVAAKMVLANAYAKLKTAGVTDKAIDAAVGKGVGVGPIRVTGMDMYFGKGRMDEALERNGGASTYKPGPR